MPRPGSFRQYGNTWGGRLHKCCRVPRCCGRSREGTAPRCPTGRRGGGVALLQAAGASAAADRRAPGGVAGAVWMLLASPASLTPFVLIVPFAEVDRGVHVTVQHGVTGGAVIGSLGQGQLGCHRPATRARLGGREPSGCRHHDRATLGGLPAQDLGEGVPAVVPDRRTEPEPGLAAGHATQVQRLDAEQRCGPGPAPSADGGSRRSCGPAPAARPRADAARDANTAARRFSRTRR